MNKYANYLHQFCCCCLLFFLFTTLVFGQSRNRQIAQHAQVAEKAQREGDFAKAIHEYTTLSRMMPGVAEVHSNLGVAYYFHKKRPEAFAAFKRALKLNPNLTSALIFSGIVNFEMSRTTEAIKLLEQAVHLNQSDPLAQTWLGFSYTAQSRFREAVNRFQIASRLTPNDVDVLYGLGQAYTELGQQELELLIEKAPNGARVFQFAGDLWMLRGEEEKARSLYQQALSRRPDLIELQQLISKIQNQEGGSFQTIRSSNQISIPNKSFLDEDKSYQAATKFRESAKQAFERIAAINPNSHRAHQILAESLITEDRLDEALAEYRVILSLKPDLAGIHLEIGNLLMSQGKAADALGEYNAELLLRPNDAQLHYRIGRALIVLGKAGEAESFLIRALAFTGTPPSTHRELGRIYLTRGQAAKAIKSLSKYLSSSRHATNDSTVHYLLIRAYRAVGDDVSAEDHLTKFKMLSDNEKQRASIQEALSLFNRQKNAEQ